jgi:hypothetical protein
MLHSYAFSNFRSFRERTEVRLTLAENAAVNGWASQSPYGNRVSHALAIIGPNGSGKTSLIQPLAFLAWFVRYSFGAKPDSPVPIRPHFAARNEPSTFEIIVDADQPKTLWRYSITVTQERVLTEKLERKFGRGHWQLIFNREWSDNKYAIEQNDFGLDPGQAANVRANVSLISWAVQFGVPLAKTLSDFVFFANMDATGKITSKTDAIVNCAEWYAKNEKMRDQMRELLTRWDFGLSNVTIHEFETPDPADPSGATKVKQWFPIGVHSLQDKKEQYVLPFFEESSGTRSAFVLLVAVLAVLEGGGCMVYDELDSDLHPMMLPALLELFDNPETNPRQAQILFTTHQIEVLRLLQKSQVMIVEKDELESQAWRLDELEDVRSDENRVARYMAGAYGGVPRL